MINKQKIARFIEKIDGFISTSMAISAITFIVTNILPTFSTPIKAVTNLTSLIFGIAYISKDIIEKKLVKPLLKPRKVTNLTDNEKKLVRDVFNGEVDVDNIKKAYIDFESSQYIANYRYKDSTISFYGLKTHEDDFTENMKFRNLLTFMHEMTHAWQHTFIKAGKRKVELKKHFMPRFLKKTLYKYKLKKNKPFMEYKNDQQATMIEHYLCLTLLPKSLRKDPFLSEYEDALLKEAVEKQFPNIKTLKANRDLSTSSPKEANPPTNIQP